MLNIRELESRWLRYKIKSYLPYFTIIFSLIVIAIVISLMFTQSNTEVLNEKNISLKENSSIQLVQTAETKSQSTQTVEKKPQEAQISMQASVVKQETHQDIQEIQQTQEKRSSRVLKPSMDFLQELEQISHSHAPIDENIEEVVLEPALTSKQKIKKDTQKVEHEEVQKNEPLQINIRRKNAHEDIAGVIKRFKKNNNPALSLFIAKKYYELEDYRNAYNYALITNEINRDIESSWIIFSKSLVKIGKKEMAIKTLQEYIKESQSDSARILLDEITSGKFR